MNGLDPWTFKDHIWILGYQLIVKSSALDVIRSEQAVLYVEIVPAFTLR
jgi:hypothetical protein